MIAIFLMLLTAINAVVAGILFIVDPSGQKMGLSPEYLVNSPFSNYLVPGLLLLITNGLLNIMALIACVSKARDYPLLVVLQGVLLCGWIIIQVMLVKNLNFLHVFMFLIGAVLAICGIILQRHYKSK